MTLSVIKTLIVEDHIATRIHIQNLVACHRGFFVAGSCGSVHEATKLINKCQPDLLLLDIHLPDGTGFDILKAAGIERKVIFLTAYEQHAILAIKAGALDYVLKPIDEAELAEALDKVPQYFPIKNEQINVASRYHDEDSKSKLILRSTDLLEIVEIHRIVYCHSDSGYSTFHLNDGQKIKVSKILKDYEGILKEPLFIRTHQSYLVNSSYIVRYIKEGLIQLKDGSQVPVAILRKKAVINFLDRF